MTDITRHVLIYLAAAAMLAVSPFAFAQNSAQTPPAEEPQEDGALDTLPEIEILPDAIPFEDLRRFGSPDTVLELEDLIDAEAPEEEVQSKVTIVKPDYSRLPESEERKLRLDALFERLQAEENPEAANLIAEEVWAIWLDSGSASVDLLLRRGTAAQKRGDNKLARRMYNHVIELSPQYAEGWARSARLAYEEEDLSRALTEATQALILEPRQFYAHWTLGNIFEKIGRTEEAYETYKEANRLYPQLLPVKDRLEMMRGSLEGDVL